jgi:AraC-like DNA-binding protein
LVRTDSRPQSEAPGVRRLVNVLTDELEDETSAMSPLVIAEIEQAILVAYLCGSSHNYSALLERRVADAAPWQVRRVEDYIEANWDRPPSTEAIAAAADISARTVFRTFRERRGFSPTTFLKQVRLRKAQEMLIRAAKDASVTSVAFACGFGNLGHFANDYRRVLESRPPRHCIAPREVRLADREARRTPPRSACFRGRCNALQPLRVELAPSSRAMSTSKQRLFDPCDVRQSRQS